MTLIRKLVSVACWALLSISYSVSNAQTITTGQLDPTQIYTTGNIVQPTIQGSGTTPWVNGVYQDSLTCWGWGMPGYCGPNAIVRPGDNINFSFGLTNLYQIQAISSVLPNSGTGLRVNGYNFGFTAKNGNGWDDGRLDYLTAYVSFYDPKGSTVYNKNYDLNYQFNWTTFNFSETFNTPYASKDLGSVQYGFVGRDNNYWAGPYGPEIYNVNFSLKYSVDPCSVNILSSPSCPSYLDELAKLNSTSTLTLTSISTTPTTTTTITNDPIQPIVTNYSAPTTTTSTAPVSASVSSTQQSSTSSNPTEKNVAGPSLTTILGIVRNEQSRISGVESSAISQANETASSLSSQAQKQAEQTASAAVANSQTSSQTQNSSLGGANIGTNIASLQSLLPNNNSSGGLSIGSLRPPTEFSTYQAPITTSSSNYASGRINKTEESVFNASTVSYSVFSFTEVKKIEPVKIQEQEIPKQPSIEFVGRSPITDYLDSKPQNLQDGGRTEQKPTEAKKSIPDSEIAGGVTLTAIAKQPPGFELYMMQMKDASFYAPKEIYKNQRTVDNERILRQMNIKSDRLHQEMVNEQYKN